MRLFWNASTPLLFVGALLAGAAQAQQGPQTNQRAIDVVPAPPPALPAPPPPPAVVVSSPPPAVVVSPPPAFLTPAQQPLIEITPVTPAKIDVSVQLDHPNGRYVAGELVKMDVIVDAPSYVTALNVAPDGRVTVLFPNQYNRDNHALPGRALRIPGPGAGLQVTPPVGREIIKIIATQNPLPLASMTDFRQVGPFAASPPGGANLVARAIQVIAAPPPSPATPSAPASAGVWGETVVVIETSEAPAYAPPPPPPVRGLTLRVMQEAYRVGEPMAFAVLSDRDCYLSLLNVAPSGRAAVLFPIAPQAPRRIPGGVWVQIPGSIAPTRVPVAGRPAGRHIVAALCSTTDQPVVAAESTLYAAGVELINTGVFSQRALQVVYSGAPAAQAVAQTRVAFIVYE